MTANGTSTPAYGRRLIPNVLDELRNTDPTRVYAAIPKTADVKDGFVDITVADLARCVDFMAQWIEDRFGKSDKFETITYVGPSEPRGPVLFLAAVKAGYKLLLPSPRNTPSINLSLMEQTGSTKLLHAPELGPLIKPMRALAPSIHIEAVPTFEEMLDSNPAHYPFSKSFEEARNDPIIVLHSSGSTGTPKPITSTHGSWAACDNEHNMPSPPGRKKRDISFFKFDEETRMFLILPFFHLGGFWFFICHAIFNNLTLVLGPPHIAPDAIMLKEMARQQKLKGIMVVPAMLQEILHEPDGMDFLRNLKFASVAGAPASAAVGDKVSSVVDLFNFIGSTETFPLPELHKDREDWLYHEFPPFMKHEMQPYDESEGTYELVIIADESNKDLCPLYHNVPGVNPYYTKDLFTRHPNKPNLYEYFGRRDDIIVLANGEKVNPIPLEQHVQGHASVLGALLVGNEKSQTALLVEPKEPLDKDSQASFLEFLWPQVVEANTHIPGPGRVAPGKVICAASDKPFARTAKNTLIRKVTERSYKDEIDAAYSTSDEQGSIANVSLAPTIKTVYEPSSLINFLRQVLATYFPPAATIGEDEDFFAYGLDSVQTLGITGRLKQNLQAQTSKSFAWLSPRTIFRNASLVDLSKVLAGFLMDDAVPDEDSQLDRARAVDDAVARHVQGLPSKPVTQAATSNKTSAVAIIGSTGYLGLYTLATLLKNTEISRIYCLNRGDNAEEKQAAALSSLDPALESLLQKLTYIKIEIGKPLLGLTQEHYELIANEVDAIIYNSWRLDFGIAVRSFDPFLRATRDLVDLSVASKHKLRIIFISSLSSVENLANRSSDPKTPIPETPVEDSLAALNTGYGQSKLAAERILITANRQSGVPVSIVRVGQVGGPSKGIPGVWADQQWISAIIRSAKALGSFPNPVVPIDWIPVDTVAAMLQGFVVRPAQNEAQVYNVCSDKPQPWDLLVSIVRETIGIHDIVPLIEWVNKLRSIDTPSDEDVAKLPALKMLDWYKTLGDGSETINVATSHARTISKVDIPPVDQELLGSWLSGWNL
ncbi:putative Carrier domain-containing protein [Seiridium cardinale]